MTLKPDKHTVGARTDSQEEWAEFVTRVQELALKAFPNPQRVGCPDAGAIHEVAAQRLPGDHPAFGAHIARCSPCIAAVIAERSEIQRRQTRVRWLLLASGLIIGMAILWMSIPAMLQVKRPAPSSPMQSQADGSSETVRLVLRPDLTTRGAFEDNGRNEIRVPSGTSVVSLSLALQPNQYAFYELSLQTPDGQEVWHTNDLQAEVSAGKQITVSAEVPSGVFQNQSYIVKLYGRRGSDLQLVEGYSFRAIR